MSHRVRSAQGSYLFLNIHFITIKKHPYNFVDLEMADDEAAERHLGGMLAQCADEANDTVNALEEENMLLKNTLRDKEAKIEELFNRQQTAIMVQPNHDLQLQSVAVVFSEQIERATPTVRKPVPTVPTSPISVIILHLTILHLIKHMKLI